MKSLKSIFLLLMLASTLAFSATTVAQSAQPSAASLKWATMTEVTFKFAADMGSAQQKALVNSIFHDKIQANAQITERKDSPIFALIHSIKDSNNVVYTFAMLDIRDDYDYCDHPMGGFNSTRDYSVCPLRVLREDLNTKQQKVIEMPKYCFHSSYGNAPDKDSTQIAFDRSKNVVYFRVTQYGKIAPECNRSIQLN